MSYPITLTSDKSEFQNYLSDNIKLVKNSEVCLTKTALSIPVKVNQYITIPFIAGGDRANSVFTAYLDGITQEITWTDIHTAYTSIDANHGFEPLTADNFYSGSLKLPLNNFVIYSDPNNADEKYMRGNISSIIAKAFESKFLFYDVQSQPEITYSSLDSFTIGDTLTINGTTYDVFNFQPYRMDLGFSVQYSPQDMSSLVVAIGASWDAVIGNPTVSNDASGTQIVSTVGNGTGDFDTIANNLENVDPNGGFIAFRPAVVPTSSEIIVGLSNSLDQGISSSITSLDSENIPIGVRITKDSSDNMYVQILDGFHYHDHGANEENNNNNIPFDNIVDAAVTTTYFILCQRSNINKENPFTYGFSVYQNTVDSDFEGADTELIYQSQNSYPNIFNMTPTVMCNQTGITVNNIKQVNVSVDSVEQIDSIQGSLTTPTEIATFSIQSAYESTDNTLDAGIFDFFNNIGFLLGYDSVSQNRPNKLGVNHNNLMYSIVYPRKVAQNIAVSVGTENISNTFEVKTFGNGEQYIDYTDSSVLAMPRFIDVKINDMTIQSIAGQYVPQSGNIYTTTSITRDVCQIPVPDKYLDPENSFNLDVSYEPYNLIYRQLHNETQISLNQFIMKVSYKNFTTNQEVNIKDINGTLKIELHVRPSVNSLN